MKNKEKVCNNCRRIYGEEKCPSCGESSHSDSFKGEVEIFNVEKSTVAKIMKIGENGRFAIKIK